MNRAIVRDGKPYSPAGLEELEILPGTRECLDRLRRMGFLLIGVSNQPDVARGTQSRRVVEDMNSYMRRMLPLDDFLVCFHDDADNCGCRKPKPGLLEEAAGRYGLSLNECFMIGDRWRDVDAGHAAGAQTIWIDFGYKERGPSTPPDARVRSLFEAVEWIAQDVKRREIPA